MVLIGVLVLAAAAAFGIDVVWLNQSSLKVEGFGQVVSTTPAAVFVAGAVTGLAGALAIMLLRDGFVRRAVRRREARIADAAMRERLAERDRMAEAYERQILREERADRSIDLRDRKPEPERAESSERSIERAEQDHVSTF